MNFKKYSCLLLVVFLALTSFKKPQVNEWVYEREKKGIKVFTKKSKWGKLRDSRAVMIVPTSATDMHKLITDFNNYPSWVPRCKSAKVIAHISDNEFIGYLVFNAPWPVANRDCIVRVKTEISASGVITIRETSEPKYLKPVDGVVRIEQVFSTWKFTPTANGTEVVNEYSSNPGGSIPDWMINTQSVENPLVTFENIQGKVVLVK